MTCVINDPLGQTHSPTSSYFQTTFVLFYDILKSGDGRTDILTETCAKIMTVGRQSGSKILADSSSPRNLTLP